MAQAVHLTGVERTFDSDDIIVSKTDLKGRITYANDVFLHVAGYGENEVLGQPHNLIRHPEMPRSIFKFLWNTITAGDEIFAYVVNRCKNGDHYWVLAHVTPTYDAQHQMIGFHSSRRSPSKEAVAKVIPLYKTLCEIEAASPNAKEGMGAALSTLQSVIDENGGDYGRFVLSL